MKGSEACSIWSPVPNLGLGMVGNVLRDDRCRNVASEERDERFNLEVGDPDCRESALNGRMEVHEREPREACLPIAPRRERVKSCASLAALFQRCLQRAAAFRTFPSYST